MENDFHQLQILIKIVNKKDCVYLLIRNYPSGIYLENSTWIGILKKRARMKISMKIIP